MRVLVTGALGFVGNAVMRQLVADGHEPIALSSRRDARSKIADVHTVHADIRDRSALASVVDEVAPEGVCHLAALTSVRDSFSDPLGYYDVNVAGTLNLLYAVAPQGPVPVVLASTGAVYGAAEGRISEDHPTAPAQSLRRLEARIGAAPHLPRRDRRHRGDRPPVLQHRRRRRCRSPVQGRRCCRPTGRGGCYRR